MLSIVFSLSAFPKLHFLYFELYPCTSTHYNVVHVCYAAEKSSLYLLYTRGLLTVFEVRGRFRRIIITGPSVGGNRKLGFHVCATEERIEFIAY